MESKLNLFDQLFDQDSYLHTSQVHVQLCEEVDDPSTEAKYKIACQTTPFYPEGGGQVGDIGSLGNISVLDTQRELGSDGVYRIYHYTHEPIPPGQTVEARIHWPRRFSLMQHHSAEHILSGLTHQKHGYDNVGFSLHENSSTLDFSGFLSPEEIDEIFYQANQVIQDNRPLQIEMYPEAQEGLEYRSKMEIQGPLRLIRVPGVDLCACSAPHLHNTGEIGLVLYTKIEKVRKGVRIHYLAGQKAYAYAKAQTDTTQKLSEHFSLPVDKILEGIEKQEKHIKGLEDKLSEINDYLWPKQVESANKNHVLIVENAPFDQTYLRYQVKKFDPHALGSRLFVLKPQGPNTQFYLSEWDNTWMDSLRSNFDLKGGGPPELSQGILFAPIDEILSKLRDSITMDVLYI